MPRKPRKGNEAQFKQQTQPAVAPKSDAFPSEEPTIKVVFKGLLSMRFNGDGECEVGIHNTTHETGRPQRHDLIINLWTKRLDLLGSKFEPCSGPIRFPVGNPKNCSRGYELLAFRTKSPGVHVYEPTAEPFDRESVNNDPKDFRWILDLEGAHFYDTRLTRYADTITPNFHLNNGLFYTLQKTKSTFRRVDPKAHGEPPHHLGNVASIIAANIYLPPMDGYAVLRIDDVRIRLDSIENVQYQVDITNECNVSGECDYQPGAGSKQERNDFYLHFDTFKVPDGKPEYELVLETFGEFPEKPDACGEFPKKPDVSSQETKHPLIDTAPCAPVGFGSGVPGGF